MKKIITAALFCAALPLAGAAAQAADLVAPTLPVPDSAPAAQAPVPAPSSQTPAPPVAAVTAPDLEVAGAYAFATAPSQAVGAAFVVLQNTGTKDLVLLDATTPVSESVELHTMTMENGIMEMRMVENFPIAAGSTIAMTPQGDHLMLIGLHAPLKVGQTFPIILEFDGGLSLETVFKVTAPGEAMPIREGGK